MTTEPGVIESKTGTMPEAEGQKPPEAEVKTPEAASRVSPKAYTEEEVKALVHSAKSETGREKAALEKEVAALKKQVETKDAEMADNASEIEALQEKFDNLASDDPDRFNVAKELREARAERKQLKDDRRVLDTEKETHGETVKLAQDTLREVAIWDLSAGYENGDPVRLKDLCDVFEAKSEEQIRKVADTLWAKKATLPSQPPTLHPFTSETVGGGESLEGLSSKELLRRAYSKK